MAWSQSPRAAAAAARCAYTSLRFWDFVAPEPLLRELADNGQIATQYCDAEGTPSGDIEYNPNGSYWAVEGITSADGRIFGKMGHSERVYGKLYKNIPHTRENGMFASAVRYFKG